MTLIEKLDLLKANSTLVCGDKSDCKFRLNFNKYSDPEIKSLGFRSANGCVFVNTHVRGVEYGSYAERNYEITDRETVKLLLAYAESEGISINECLARQVGYPMGSNTPKEENVKLGNFSVDIEMMRNGKFDVYIAHDGSSGEHHVDVTADRIGDLVAELVECVAEAYQ